MNRKYEFTRVVKEGRNGMVLHRIRAVRSFGGVKAGDLGGWIQSEDNLSHAGNAWVADEAIAAEDSYVSGDALADDHAQLYGNAVVTDRAHIGGHAIAEGESVMMGDASILGEVRLYGNGIVSGISEVVGNAVILNRRDLFTVYPVASTMFPVTFAMDSEDGTVYATFLGIGMTMDEFWQKVYELSENVRDYTSAVTAAQAAHISLTGELYEAFLT